MRSWGNDCRKGYDSALRQVFIDCILFARYLERVELLLDKSTGKPRTLYSLRHMYATFALTFDRMSVYTLSEHMGTSVKMIEDHYGQLLLRDKAHVIAGDKEWIIEKAKREAKARLRGDVVNSVKA